jgi:hypothetical protein
MGGGDNPILVCVPPGAATRCPKTDAHMAFRATAFLSASSAVTTVINTTWSAANSIMTLLFEQPWKQFWPFNMNRAYCHEFEGGSE